MLDLNEIRDEMEQALKGLERGFSKIRTGRANPKMLEHVKVMAYGSETELEQVALINVPEARQLTVKPYDPTLIKDIEAAINKSDLGINPIADSEIIRLNIPPLTEDTRRDYVKEAKTEAENARIKIRNIRKDYHNKIKKSEDFSENQMVQHQEEVQKLTDEFNEKIEKLLETKENDIMTI